MALAQQVEEVFARLGTESYECLFVDDGSTDTTPALLRLLHARNPRILGVRLSRNCGQSAALVAGLRACRGAAILTLDGDLQNDPSDFPRFLELLQEYDCVCGFRATRRDTWLRRVSSRVANAVRNAVLHDGIRDSGCGAKGIRRECVQYIVAFNGVHRFMAAILRRAGCSIVECPVKHHPRQHGVSKYGTLDRLGRGVVDLLGVAWLLRRSVYPRIEPNETAQKEVHA